MKAYYDLYNLSPFSEVIHVKRYTKIALLHYNPQVSTIMRGVNQEIDLIRFKLNEIAIDDCF